MARGPSKAPGKSKIRFIMLEAELSEGDLSEVTSAIQNALRPMQPQLIVQRLDAGGRTEFANPDVEDLEDFGADFEESEPNGEDRSSTKKRRTSYRTPKVVELNCDATPPLKDYARLYPPPTHNDKHLVILGWANEVDQLSSLTVDQVYTAFRHLDWPSGQKDFSQPLRDLKRQQLVTGSSKDGFKINHIGLGKIEKFKSNG